MSSRSVNYSGLSMSFSEQQIDTALHSRGTLFTKRKWYSIVAIVSVFVGWSIGPLGSTGSLMRLFVFCVASSVVAAILLWVGRIVLAMTRDSIVEQLRLKQFASDNGFTYTLSIPDPNYPGVIFGTGSYRRIYDQFIGNANGEFEVGNYEYTVRQGKSSTTYRRGYIRIALVRHVAHMLLDGTANNTNLLGANLSNLPIAMSRDQTLQLEGDFNKHFTLYAPKEYERDALYVFTPDLMGLLIDEANQFDVEVIDDQLYVYGKEFDLSDQASWRRVFAIISTVGAKTISQTDYYADEQVGDRKIDAVASGGRRLRRGIPWVPVVAAVSGFLFVAVQVIIDWVIQR